MVGDLLLSAAAIFVILRFFNTPRLMKYLLLMVVGLALLAVTANYTLPSLHFVSQAFLIVLLVGLPVFAEEQLSQLFRPGSAPISTNVISTSRTVNPALGVLLSIVVAVLLTGLTNGPGLKTAELPQGVTVSAANAKEGISANFGTQKRINVIVRAPRSAWPTLDADDFSASVDVKGLAEGTHEAVVTVTSKVQNVEVVRVKPTRVTVALEPVIRKTVIVVARFSGKAADDLVPDEPVFQPDKVEVTGPKSIVQDITQAVAQISLDNQSQKIEQKYQLVALNSSGSVLEDITFSPAEVDTKVALVKAGKLKTVGVRVKTSGQPATGYWVSEIITSPSSLLVTAPADTLDKLSAIDTDAVALTGISKDTEVVVNLAFPSGVVAADSTSKVTVKLKLSETATTKSVTPTISYEGVDPSLKVTTINPTSVNAIVSGSAGVLAGVGGGDVQLKLNLSAYKSAGTYAVTITSSMFTLKEGVSLVSFLPSAINVTLELK